MAQQNFTGGGKQFTILEPTTITDQSSNGWGFLQNVGNTHIMAHTKFAPSYEQMKQDGSSAGLFLTPGEVIEIAGATEVHVDTADGIYPVTFVLSEKI